MVTEKVVALTDSAVKKVKEIFAAEADAKGKSLRIAVVPGGCSGFEYAFSFDAKQADDAEVAFDGFNVLVDSRSAGYLKNSTIDFVEGPTGSGFKIANPNVKKSCGCGQSNQF